MPILFCNIELYIETRHITAWLQEKISKCGRSFCCLSFATAKMILQHLTCGSPHFLCKNKKKYFHSEKIFYWGKNKACFVFRNENQRKTSCKNIQMKYGHQGYLLLISSSVLTLGSVKFFSAEIYFKSQVYMHACKKKIHISHLKQKKNLYHVCLMGCILCECTDTSHIS